MRSPEVITDIKEVEVKKNSGSHHGTRMAGYRITTSEQVIEILIDDDSISSEYWGYFTSEDDTQYFLGAELLGVSVTDTALKTYDMEDLDGGDIMFVDIKTTKGVLQFVAYNSHDGYYGHEAIVRCKNLDYSIVL